MCKGDDPEPAEVLVRDAGELVERARLPILRLADGRTGTLFRGQVFPLAADGSIDIAGPYVTPEECAPPARASGGWSLIRDGEEAVLLLSGGAAERDRALAALRARGVGVQRFFPALDPDLEADWIVRLAPGALAADAEAELGRVFAGLLEGPPPASEALRIRLLELERDRLRGENAALRRELEALRAAGRAAAELVSEPSGPEAPPSPAAGSAPAATASEAGPTVGRGEGPIKAPSERLARKLSEEIAALLAAFPRIELLRGSLLTLLTDYRDRRAFYRLLAELDRGEALQRRFKPVRGCEGWFECHLSTGQDDSGRLYARRGSAGSWQVLVSIKEHQRRDLERLRRS